MIKSGALGELAAMKHFLSLGYEVYKLDLRIFSSHVPVLARHQF